MQRLLQPSAHQVEQILFACARIIADVALAIGKRGTPAESKHKEWHFGHPVRRNAQNGAKIGMEHPTWRVAGMDTCCGRTAE